MEANYSFVMIDLSGFIWYNLFILIQGENMYTPAAVATMMRYALEDASRKVGEMMMDFGESSTEYMEAIKEVATIKSDITQHQKKYPSLYR
jgi:hypothetical protein